jgi:hypothetical protein
MKRRQARNMRLLHLSGVHFNSNYDIDITAKFPSPIMTTNYDALQADTAVNWSVSMNADTDHFMRFPHHFQPRTPRLSSAVL